MKPSGIRDSRAWAALDVGYFDNPKVVDVLDASSTAINMHVASILYCSQHFTDGHAPVKMLQRKTGGTAEDVALLCEAGMWHRPGHDCPECPQPEGSRVYVHNFLEHNRSEAEANAASERARRAANIKHAGRRAGRTATGTADRSASGTATSSATSTAEGSAPGMRPRMHRQTDRQTSSPTERGGAPAPAVADAPAAPTAKGHRLPDGWEPRPEVIQQMTSEAPHVDLRREHAKFTDYWTSQPGARGRKTDWNAVWRNWVRRAAEQAPRTGNRSTDRAVAGWQAMSRPTTHHQQELEP